MKLVACCLALIVVVFLPLSARSAETSSYDVCVNLATDVRASGFSFVAVGKIFPGGTITDASATVCPSTGSIGTFFTTGAVVSDLPNASPGDFAFVTWHFRIDNKGAFDTVGPVEGSSVPQYPQTIVGSTHNVAPTNGEAMVTTLETTPLEAFRIFIPSSSSD